MRQVVVDSSALKGGGRIRAALVVVSLLFVGLFVTPASSANADVGTCSVNQGAAGPVTFVNNSPDPVWVNWVGFDCVERTYATLQPGTSYVQATYTGHLWLLRRTSNNTAVTDVRPVLPNSTVIARGNGICSEGVTSVNWSLKNSTSSALDLYFIDSQCLEVSYGVVAAGATRPFSSVVGHRWRLKVAGTDRVVGETTVLRAEAAVFSTSPQTVLARSTTDRADSTNASQLKVLYAIPSDGADLRWDVNGRIGLSLAGGNRWLAEQSAGRRLRIDTATGAPDITFVRLPRTAAQYSSFGAFARNEIERDLQARGFNRSNKKYLVFYQVPGTSCGSSYWPPSVPGNASVVFLKACSEDLAGDPVRFGFVEAAWVHEVFHGLGATPSCAPHHTRAGHVSGDPSDLMYAGDRPWRPALLDVGRDDYFTSSSSCPGILGSPFLS